MNISDTAGLRSLTEDKIEKLGIDMAKGEAKSSHGLIFVLDIMKLDYEVGPEGDLIYKFPENLDQSDELHIVQEQLLEFVEMSESGE